MARAKLLFLSVALLAVLVSCERAAEEAKEGADSRVVPGIGERSVMAGARTEEEHWRAARNRLIEAYDASKTQAEFLAIVRGMGYRHITPGAGPDDLHELYACRKLEGESQATMTFNPARGRWLVVRYDVGTGKLMGHEVVVDPHEGPPETPTRDARSDVAAQQRPEKNAEGGEPSEQVGYDSRRDEILDVYKASKTRKEFLAGVRTLGYRELTHENLERISFCKLFSHSANVAEPEGALTFYLSWPRCLVVEYDVRTDKLIGHHSVNANIY